MKIKFAAIIVAMFAIACAALAEEAEINVDVKVKIRSTSSYMYYTQGEVEIWEYDTEAKKATKLIETITITWGRKSNGGYLKAELEDYKIDLPEEGSIIARAVFRGKVAKEGGQFTEDSHPEELDKVMQKSKPRIRFNQLSINAR